MNERSHNIVFVVESSVNPSLKKLGTSPAFQVAKYALLIEGIHNWTTFLHCKLELLQCEVLFIWVDIPQPFCIIRKHKSVPPLRFGLSNCTKSLLFWSIRGEDIKPENSLGLRTKGNEYLSTPCIKVLKSPPIMTGWSSKCFVSSKNCRTLPKILHLFSRWARTC